MKYDIIVVGGGPAGIIAAVTAKKNYPKKKILAIKSVDAGVVPCGIPYMFNTLKKCEDNALGAAPFKNNGIDVLIDTVTCIDKKKKVVTLKENKPISYEKLILATGAEPVIPPLPGIDLKGVYPIVKEMNYLKKMRTAIKKAKNVVIIGGGFIGVEIADEVANYKDKKVTLIEFEKRVLAHSFDQEFSEQTEALLKKKGINVLTGTKAEKIMGKEKATGIMLSTKKKLAADIIILGIGAKPHTTIAEKCGLQLNNHKAIVVDEYLRTSDPDILAIGDCAEKKDFFTRKVTNVMLASTATAEARVAGANLYSIKLLRRNKGTIAAYSTMIDSLALGSAGLTEQAAKKAGFDIITGMGKAPDRHPGKLPGMKEMTVKLVFQKESGVLLGGQTTGGLGAGEVVNIIAVAIQKNMSMSELETLQIATHPKLTAAPTVYPIITAAQQAMAKMT